jgi:hypothetical protein
MLIIEATGSLRNVDAISSAVTTLTNLSGLSPLNIACSPFNDYVLFSTAVAIYKLDMPTLTVALFAGQTLGGYADGVGTSAMFKYINDFAISKVGSFALVVDGPSYILRKIFLLNATVTTIAGTLTNRYAEGSGLNISFSSISGVDISSDGSFAVVTDVGRIRMLDLTTDPITSSFVAGSKTGASGSVDGIGEAALFAYLYKVAISPDMNFAVIVQFANNLVRKIILSTGSVTTLCAVPGSGQVQVYGVTFGGRGFTNQFYITTAVTNLVYRLDLPTNNITVFAGNGSRMHVDHTSNGLLASFNVAAGMALMPCIPGYGADNASAMCSQCPINTYSATGVCVVCPMNTVSVAGSAYCQLICPVGNYCPFTTAIPCQSGTYFTGTGATVCTQCTSGTFSTGTEISVSSTCVKCTPGTYAAQNASSTCIQCAGGSYSSAIGSSSVDACTPCPSNSFCPQSSTQPTPCPTNATSPPSSTSYLNCTCAPGTSGFVANATYGWCAACAKGMFCAGVGTVCGC